LLYRIIDSYTIGVNEIYCFGRRRKGWVMYIVLKHAHMAFAGTSGAKLRQN